MTVSAAQIVEDELSPARAPNSFSLEAHCRVRAALQSVYPVLGIDCDMVGEGYMIQRDICGSNCSAPRAPAIHVGNFTGYDHNSAEGCPSGQFYTQHGAGSCQKCELGTYKSTTGIAECGACGEGRTTVAKGATSEDDCVCPKEFLTDGNGECLQCASSMICDTANTTVLSLR